MEFSVLMSVYCKDNPDFFKLALESVSINQTLKPNQIVVVQDGPLASVFDEIILNLSESLPSIEFTTVKLEKNSGLAVALNAGINACKYEWIARMDSDDVSVPERFEKQIRFIEEHSDIGVVGGIIAEFQNEIGDMLSERRVGLIQADILRMAKKRTPMNHVSVFYNKNAVLGAGKYSEDFGKLEDYKLWVDMLSDGVRFANIDEVLVYVRVGNGFIERRSNKREIQDWDMLQRYLLKNRFINSFTALKNKIYIRIFIYMPKWLKKLAYKKFLRK